MSREFSSELRSEGASGLDPLLFREILATFPAGVVIVTAVGADGTSSGLTVSAFCSVSAVPPLVLVCVDRGSNTLSAIQHSEMFTVNILAAGRAELALRFASKRTDKFADIAHEPPTLPRGGPILRNDAASYLVCRLEQSVEAGDHWVFIGEALEAGVHEDERPLPLVYHNRSFSSVSWE